MGEDDAMTDMKERGSAKGRRKHHRREAYGANPANAVDDTLMSSQTHSHLLMSSEQAFKRLNSPDSLDRLLILLDCLEAGTHFRQRRSR